MNEFMEVLDQFVFPIFIWIFIIYMVITIGMYVVIFFVSARDLRKGYLLHEQQPYEEYLVSYDSKPLSVIVPAYNEEKGILGSVRSLLSMNYPEFEVIIVNDGSTDDTLPVLLQQFEMRAISSPIRTRLHAKRVEQVYQSQTNPNVFVIDKENGGKADALNAGINFSKYPYICSIDGDSVLDRDAFLKVMKPIIEANDQVIATGGSIRVANGCKIERGEVMNITLPRSPMVIIQVVEYLRAFLIGRNGLSRFNLLLIISGAFGVFDKEWVIKAGGYRTHTVGEDMELVVRLHRLVKETKSNKKIIYIPDSICWTEVPDQLSVLRSQRHRWHRGLFQTLIMHRKMLLNPRYGFVGMASMPFYFFFELFGVFVELFGYILIPTGVLLNFVNIPVALVLFTLSLFLGSFLSVAAVLLEEWSVHRYPSKTDIIILFFYALSESFWYRPLTVFWRFEGIIQAFGKSSSWGEMTRKGVSQ